MSKIIRWLIACMVPVALFGMAAFLIYKQADGWGWFLLCVFLIIGGTSLRID